jgi:hypothetical protein
MNRCIISIIPFALCQTYVPAPAAGNNEVNKKGEHALSQPGRIS